MKKDKKIIMDNWASYAIAELKEGREAKLCPKGHSMSGKIESGDTVTVTPGIEPKKGDIVLCKVRGNVYVHLVLAINKDSYQIGNNRGHINGWCSRNAIFGIVTKIVSSKQKDKEKK